jgi:hypothetical protein
MVQLVKQSAPVDEKPEVFKDGYRTPSANQNLSLPFHLATHWP